MPANAPWFAAAPLRGCGRLVVRYGTWFCVDGPGHEYTPTVPSGVSPAVRAPGAAEEHEEQRGGTAHEIMVRRRAAQVLSRHASCDCGPGGYVRGGLLRRDRALFHRRRPLARRAGRREEVSQRGDRPTTRRGVRR